MIEDDRFSKYVFIYEDSFSNWNIATNPKFIAEHKHCFAIERDDLKEIRKYIPRYRKEGK